MSRRRFIRASLALTFLAVLIQGVWAVAMPGFRGPDEPHHVNSIMRLAGGGGWPEPGDAMIDPEIHAAGYEAGLTRTDGAPFTSGNRTRLLSPGSTSAPYSEVFLTPHDERIPIGQSGPITGSVEVDQMTQHPPLYYAGGALVVKAFDIDDSPWDRALLALRLYSIAITLPLIPSMIYTARRLGAPRQWALAAGFLPFAIPQVFGITAVVTNDALAIGGGALVIAALAKAGTERISWRTVSLVGGSLGLALWSKGLLLALGLPLILVFLLAKNETWRTRILATLAAGSMALAIGWWWIANIVRYGVLQPAGYSRPVPDGWDGSQAEVSNYLIHAFRTFTRSFFSSFGWLEVNFPQTLTLILLALFLGLTLWGVIRAGQSRTLSLILLTPFAGLIALLYAQGWLNHVATAAVAGVQGRYLYPTIAAFAVIVLGLRVFGRRGYVLFGLSSIALGMFGLIWLLSHAYPGSMLVDASRFAEAAGLPVAGIAAVMVIWVAANAGLAGLVIRWSGELTDVPEELGDVGQDESAAV